MKKWFSILFFNLCHWPDCRLRKCSTFYILCLCSILFFIVSHDAGAQNNSDIIHQNDLKRALVLKTLVLQPNADYDGNKIIVSGTTAIVPTKDSFTLQKLVPYISIALILFVLAIVMKFLILPEINFEKDQSVMQLSFFKRINGILKQPKMVLGVIVLIFYLYVGSEIFAVNSIDGFVKKLEVYGGNKEVYHKLILYTMTAMVTGCILGMVLIPKYVSLITFLKLSCLLGVLLAVAILFISPCTMIVFPGIQELPVVIILVALMGFVNALFWPVICSIVFQDFKD